MSEKRSRLTVFLIGIVVVLALVLLYAFVIRPSYSGYVTKLQNQGAVQGVNYTLSTIMYLLQQNGGVVQLPVPGAVNQTVTLYASSVIPTLCSQLANTTK